MFEFAWPWILLSLPLPWLAKRFLAPLPQASRGALRVPDIADFSTLGALSRVPRPAQRRYWLSLLAWCLLVVAAANPKWLGEPMAVAHNGRDLMLAVDLSESMSTQDFILNGESVDRLTAIKSVARDFIKRRAGDRIGLLLFGERAYLNVPLTYDSTTVLRLLDETTIGLAGPSTAIGDAIGLAVKRLREQNTKHKVLILMTDGANTAGQIDPLRAAELAAGVGLKIYTIGIGADEMLVKQLFGAIRVNPSTDLDEPTMRGIAKATGGLYFRARDISALENIYGELDKLEPVESGAQFFRPATPLFPWPLGLALLCAAVETWRLVARPA